MEHATTSSIITDVTVLQASTEPIVKTVSYMTFSLKVLIDTSKIAVRYGGIKDDE